LIQVKSERQVFTHNVIEVTSETRYHISSLSETAQEIAKRIRGYWGVENKVHYVRDVTQGEDASRIRTGVSFFCWETTFWFFKGGSDKQFETSLKKVFTEKPAKTLRLPSGQALQMLSIRSTSVA
jgi:hypothetical protein